MARNRRGTEARRDAVRAMNHREESARRAGRGTSRWFAFGATPRPLHVVLALLLADALLTLPFIFPNGVEGDTLRYAIGLHRWRDGTTSFQQLFNAEMSPAYYVTARAIAAGVDLAGLPLLLNRLAWLAGLGSTAALFFWTRRWFGQGVAVRLTALVIVTPAWWSLHLYGNANLAAAGLAMAAALALPTMDRGPRGLAPPECGAPSAGRPASGAGVVAGFVLASLLGALALAFRQDVVMLAPAMLAWAISGERRPRWRWLVPAGAMAILIILMIRSTLEFSTESGPWLRHLRGNFTPGSTRRFLDNGVAVVCAVTPLLALASAAAMAARARHDGFRHMLALAAWASPVLPFLLFSRVHLSRILIPALPALLIPLAGWAAEKGRKRDAILLLLVAASHLAMLPLPDIVSELGLRRPGGGRVNHYLFLGNMITDHRRIEALAEETWREANAIAEQFASGAPWSFPAAPGPDSLAVEPKGGSTKKDSASQGPGRGAGGPRLVAVVGEDVIFQEYALEATDPGIRLRDTAKGYLVHLREGLGAGGGRILLLSRNRPGDPEELLRELGVVGDLIILRTPTDRRHFPDDRSATETSALIGARAADDAAATIEVPDASDAVAATEIPDANDVAAVIRSPEANVAPVAIGAPGANDAAAAIDAPGVNDAAAAIDAPGVNDAAAAIDASGVNDAAAGIYASGVNNGAAGIYASGVNNGAAGIYASGVNNGAAGIYALGVNDGAAGIYAPGLNHAPGCMDSLDVNEAPASVDGPAANEFLAAGQQASHEIPPPDRGDGR